MTKNKKVVKAKNLVLTEAELQALAHSASKEAIAKIEKYWKTEKDPEKRAYAEMALEECEFFYYQPNNEKEEKEFRLWFLINDRKKKILKIEMEIGGINSRLDKFALEKSL